MPAETGSSSTQPTSAASVAAGTCDAAIDPLIGVVVPYYNDQPGLDRMLAALDLPQGVSFEVVVADDGSPTPPRTGTHHYPISVVRQDDLGFRAAAARNLGARATRAAVICFLDGDMIPAPGCLRALAAADGPTLTVGRRRHADLTGWSAAAVRDWLAGRATAPPLLDDPDWLRQGYAETDDLRRADSTSFRYVISAVLAMPRTLFDRVGGFDETLRGYGGEDWDLANRCWQVGADLRHAPDAVAWHHGPDLAGRDENLAATKNAETLQLAARITHPLVRGRGLTYDLPDIVIDVDALGWTPAQLAATTQSLLRGSDAAVWVRDGDIGAVAHDPRVHTGAPPAATLDRARVRVRVQAPVALVGVDLTTLADAVDRFDGCSADTAPQETASLIDADAPALAEVSPALTLWRTRDLGGADTSDPTGAPHGRCPAPGLLAPVAADVVLERLRQGEWQRTRRQRA